MPTVDIRYDAPPTVARFLDSDAFIRCIVGPLGSGKSSGCIMEILRRAVEQAPSPDGVRRTRWAVIRNTYRELQDTTRKTFEEWIPAAIGEWNEDDFSFRIRFGDVDAEVLFRALDRPRDVKKVLSLEVTGVYINEFREIAKVIFDGLQGRCGRYPSKKNGGVGATWFGMWMDTNPWHRGHWAAKYFSEGLEGVELYRQPGGRAADAENLANLPDRYYERLVAGKDQEWIRVYLDGQDAAGDVGSIFGAWVTAIEQRGDLCNFDHPTDGVFTNWDLGHGDATSIWFWRLNRHGVADLIDHYEAHGQSLKHFFQVIDGKGYDYMKHWLPFDAKAKTLATTVSVLDQCVDQWGADKVLLAPKLSIEDGIAAARWLLEQPARIHSRCAVAGEIGHSGVDALREYRFRWDPETRSFSRDPLHNWASHAADALRYLALVVKHSELMTRKPPPVKPPDVRQTHYGFNLDELYEWKER